MKKPEPFKSKVSIPVFTLGHSTRSLEEFIAILQRYEVKEIVDVRTVPRSGRNPQFNKETLPVNLRYLGIDYLHLLGLGGWRRPVKNSLNKGWVKAAFRGYADYMQTREFEENLKTLLGLAEKQRIAIMCAEVLPWRCHRFLIADALTVKGVEVKHIISIDKAISHDLTPWIKIDGARITYPPIRELGSKRARAC